MSWVVESEKALEARAGRTFLCHGQMVAWMRGEAQAVRGEPCDSSVSAFFGFGYMHEQGYASRAQV